LQTLNIASRSMGVSLTEGGRRLLETDEMKGKAKTSLIKFLEDLRRWQVLMKDTPPGELSEKVLEESGYTDFWRQSKTVQSAGKLENLKELVRAAGEFDTLEGYLDHVSLVAERTGDSQDGEVWLMTLHAAKGLEYPVVFLPGWEEEIFPSGRSVDENGVDGLEEERRLAYVGITRARESCRISFASNRMVYGRWQSSLPSRFIDELPEDHVEVLSEPGLYGVKAKELPAFSRFDEISSADGGYDTPGWRRARNAGPRGNAPAIEGSARLIASSSPGDNPFKMGERVFHQKFGYGEVLGGEGNKLEVAFDKAGTKKVISSFLKAASDV
ncbi:MAG: 3'-5' exonuclease, partial [Pseudomonadota bacterium]